jgi:hypothetical protein
MGRTRPVALGLLRVGTGHKTPGTKRQILSTLAAHALKLCRRRF